MSINFSLARDEEEEEKEEPKDEGGEEEVSELMVWKEDPPLGPSK